MKPHMLVAVLLVGTAASAQDAGVPVVDAGVADAGPTAIAFLHCAFETPLDVTPKPDEVVTDAVRRFKETGVNPYVGKKKAIAAGKNHYDAWCVSCHLPDATGRIGPSLVDDDVIHVRVNTDVGMFEAIHSGALGAMQPFRDRLAQDEMLQLMAYVRSLKKPVKR